MRIIKLSTGVLVPQIKDLNYGQLTYLALKPVEDDMPKDLKDYIKKGQAEWFKRPIQYNK